MFLKQDFHTFTAALNFYWIIQQDCIQGCKCPTHYIVFNLPTFSGVNVWKWLNWHKQKQVGERKCQPFITEVNLVKYYTWNNTQYFKIHRYDNFISPNEIKLKLVLIRDIILIFNKTPFRFWSLVSNMAEQNWLMLGLKHWFGIFNTVNPDLKDFTFI